MPRRVSTGLERRTPDRYKLADHLCRRCSGGRVLQLVSSEVVIYRCADCGTSGDLEDICWCHYGHAQGQGYMCLHTRQLRTLDAEAGAILRRSFGSCGTNCDKDVVGVLMRADWVRAGSPSHSAPDRIVWQLVDHLCFKCQGRMLQGVSGYGPTGGGNPIYTCSRCGNGGAGMGCVGCWCQFELRREPGGRGMFMCVPYHACAERPAIFRAMRAMGFAHDIADPNSMTPEQRERLGFVAVGLIRELERLDERVDRQQAALEFRIGDAPSLSPKGE